VQVVIFWALPSAGLCAAIFIACTSFQQKRISAAIFIACTAFQQKRISAAIPNAVQRAGWLHH
jgi:hypothetical protein